MRKLLMTNVIQIRKILETRIVDCLKKTIETEEK